MSKTTYQITLLVEADDYADADAVLDEVTDAVLQSDVDLAFASFVPLDEDGEPVTPARADGGFHKRLSGRVPVTTLDRLDAALAPVLADPANLQEVIDAIGTGPEGGHIASPWTDDGCVSGPND